MAVPAGADRWRRSAELRAHRMVERRAADTCPADLREKWRPNPPFADEVWVERVERFRRSIVPWLASTRPLAGVRLLEIGSGPGASTVAIAEQGAVVTAMDVSAEHLSHAEKCFASMGLTATFHVGNALDIDRVGTPEPFEHVVFWAVLEHMTIDERLGALSAAWRRLESGGLLTVIETPNRLWPYDSHTAQLPFFSWLPYELGIQYSELSDREGFGGMYTGPESLGMDHFLRRGHGVSFHEFDLAIGDHREVRVAASMHDFTRNRSPVRRLGWRLSRAGRAERVLGEFAPGTDAGWLQPFLYLSLVKP